MPRSKKLSRTSRAVLWFWAVIEEDWIKLGIAFMSKVIFRVGGLLLHLLRARVEGEAVLVGALSTCPSREFDDV